MGFELGKEYTRVEIAEVLGVGVDDHAVIVGASKQPLAIVVRKDGKHPSGKKYKNEINDRTFLMHGEYEWRGERLEQSAASVPLLFSHKSDGHYRYEGVVQWSKTDDWAGEPFRYFALTIK
jgi:hypothetical protein